MTVADQLSQFPLGNLCDADPRVRAMSSDIRPINSLMSFAGPAVTVAGQAGQNLALHLAIERAEPGTVLVVDMAGNREYGPFGEILAQACLARGIVGLVLDGSCRDAADIEALGFPVFCRGFCPAGTKKEAVGAINTGITCGGVAVAPGDYVVGGRDGVVIIPKVAVDHVPGRAGEIAEFEAKLLKAVKSGRTTLELLGLENIEL